MPKKKTQESQAEQSARFIKTARDLAADGKLSLTAGKRGVDGVVRGAKAGKKARP